MVARALVVRAKFDSAQTTPDNRRHWANADGLSADAAANPEIRRTLRNRARYEVANNSYARGIVLTLANDVIGTGPRLQTCLPAGEAGRCSPDGRQIGTLIETEFAAWANGYDGRNFRDSRSVLRFAFGHNLQAAGFSTIDIGGILSNVANKLLLEGFFSVERVWRNICAVRNVSDFKTVTSYRLIGKDQYEIVAPGGELKHGTLGEEKYTNKADTYGLLLAIDRRDIINDDLGAITTVPRKLGRGSGLKINDIFWATFMDNATFFTAGNNNYLEGADTALSIDGLTKAEVAFMDQVDSDGKPLYKSMELRDTTANVKYPVSNPHQGKFRVEVSRYLSNSHYTGYSSKAWYLLADANDLPVIEVAFLNGQESPTIETAEADFSVLGIQMRGVHDFGAGLQDRMGSRVQRVGFAWERGKVIG